MINELVCDPDAYLSVVGETTLPSETVGDFERHKLWGMLAHETIHEPEGPPPTAGGDSPLPYPVHEILITNDD